MKNRFIYQRYNVFRTILLSILLPCLLAVIVLSLVFLPVMTETAKRNDDAYEQQLLYAASTCLTELSVSFEDALSAVEESTWIHPLHMDLLAGRRPAYATQRLIEKELNMTCIRSSFRYFSFRFYGDDMLYSSSGVFRESIVSGNEDLQYQFFPSGSDRPVLSTLRYGGAEYLLYQAPFRVIQNGQLRGEVNILMSSDVLGRRLLRYTGPDMTAVKFTDTNGSALWEYRFAPSVKDTVTLSAENSSDMIPFSVEIPAAIHTRTRDRVFPVMAAALVSILIVCLILSYLLARFTYRPIQYFVKKYGNKKNRPGNDFLILEQAFDSILEEKNLAEDTLAYLRPFAQQKVLAALLDGTAFLEDDAEDRMRRCGVVFAHSFFNVLSLEAPFSRLTDSEYAADLALEQLLALLGTQTAVVSYLCPKEGSRYRLIVNYDKEDDLLTYIRLLTSYIGQYFETKGISGGIYLGSGSAADVPEALYHAADQADTAVYTAALNHTDHPVFYRDISGKLSDNYYYPVSEELMLSRAITSCSSTGAKSLLSSIIEENRRRSGLSPQSLRLLYTDLASTVVRSAHELDINALPASMNEPYLTPDEIGEKIEAMIDDIFAQIRQKREKTIRPKDQEILDHIDRHIYDPDLYLSSVAEAFGRSTHYISGLFREYRDTNFNNYVNRARIHRAMQLMAEEHLDSQSVYPLVGYTNLTTFRRNFTKFAKLAPGSFRGSAPEKPAPAASVPDDGAPHVSPPDAPAPDVSAPEDPEG